MTRHLVAASGGVVLWLGGCFAVAAMNGDGWSLLTGYVAGILYGLWMKTILG